jgi:hypothetical protein
MEDGVMLILEEMIEEIDREVDVRKRVFPRWVKDGKLEPQEAERRIMLLEAASTYLRMELPCE